VIRRRTKKPGIPDDNLLRRATSHMDAFSDGVFAIAITILVLEIAGPEESFENLWKGIAEQWPSYLGYATSFLTIGGIWLTHHGIFSRLAFVNRRLMQLNLLLLMAVSFLPFPTRLVAESIDTTDAERAAVVFYGVVLLAISMVAAAMWRTIATEPELLEPEVSPDEVAALALRSAPSLGFYAVVILVALVAPQVAAFGYLAIAVAAVVTARAGDPDAGHERTGRRWGRRHQGPADPGAADPGAG